MCSASVGGQPSGKRAVHARLLMVLSSLIWMCSLHRISPVAGARHLLRVPCGRYLRSAMCCLPPPHPWPRRMLRLIAHAFGLCLHQHWSHFPGCPAVSQGPSPPPLLLPEGLSPATRTAQHNVSTAALVLVLVGLIHGHYDITRDYV